MLDAKQLVWRCRRGVRELDVLLENYLQSGYQHLDKPHKLAFERLLDVQDPVIMDWLFARSMPEDKEIANLIKELRVISGFKK